MMKGIHLKHQHIIVCLSCRLFKLKKNKNKTKKETTQKKPYTKLLACNAKKAGTPAKIWPPGLCCSAIHPFILLVNGCMIIKFKQLVRD